MKINYPTIEYGGFVGDNWALNSSNLNPLFTRAYSTYTLLLVLVVGWFYLWELVSIYMYQ